MAATCKSHSRVVTHNKKYISVRNICHAQQRTTFFRVRQVTSRSTSAEFNFKENTSFEIFSKVNLVDTNYPYDYSTLIP